MQLKELKIFHSEFKLQFTDFILSYAAAVSALKKKKKKGELQKCNKIVNMKIVEKFFVINKCAGRSPKCEKEIKNKSWGMEE